MNTTVSKRESIMKGRKQLNLPNEAVDILDDFSSRYAPDGVDLLTYSQTIQAMAAKLDPPKYSKKKPKQD